MTTSDTTLEPAEGTVDVDLGAAPGVAVVTYQRGTHNYVTYEFLDQLATALEDLRRTDSRAVVLRTTARHFSAGADFVGRRSTGAKGQHIFDVVPRFFRLPLPVVAAVQGAAVGAGLGLALSADFRVASASAYFLLNFTRIGLSPGFGLTLTLPRLIGTQRAAEMLYTARRIGAAEAAAIGLCDRVAEPDAVDAEALALASEIAKSSPRAVASVRHKFRSEVAERIEATLAHELAEQEPLLASEDFREGVRAWREKRVPQFRGV